MKVYFDNAATTPMLPEVVDSMVDVMQNHFGNPSSTHGYGRDSRVIIEQNRKKVAKLLKASANEIIFTSGGTEANNIVLQCSVRDLGVKHIVTSPLEHHAVIHTLEFMASKKLIKLSIVKVNKIGEVDLEDLSKLMQTKDKTLVSLMHANNEIGNLLPLKAVATLCKANNALFHSDTVQSIGHYEFDLTEIPIDFITCSSHKFHGPKGVGFLFVREGIPIRSLSVGGAQERGKRSGTENTAGIAGLTKALELAYNDNTNKQSHLKALKNHLINGIKENIQTVSFNGLSADFDMSLNKVVNIRFPETSEGDMLLFNLDINGIAASGGSACASGSNQGSHVLQALLSTEEQQAPSIRFSFSKQNTIEEVDYLLDVLKEIYSN